MLRTLTIVTLISLLLAGCGTALTPTATQIATVAPTIIRTSTAFPTLTAIPTPISGTLFVDPSLSLGPISPLIYGSNYGPWLTVPFYMLPQAFDSGIKILRFPAGAWGDHNDVTHMQIDQFMDFANKMGATTIFSVRLLGGTPEQAAEMVHYTNIEEKYNVQYWSIGNEPTLFDAELKTRGNSYSIERFNKEWRTFAEAMKKVDPTIKLVGAEINQFSFDPTPGVTTNFGQRDEEWFIDFLKANGDLVDVVSFHRYPFPRTRASGPPAIDELRQNAREWDKIIIHARELIHQYAGRDLPIAITEFNSAYDKSVGGEATPDSHYNAIWMADVLGRMIKNGVFMANEWALTAKGESGGSGLIGALDVYPAYYAYQLYKKFGNELVYSSSDDPDLSIYAALREDGAITVMVINLSLEEKTKAIRIGDQAQVQAETWLFDPEHKGENIGSVELSNGIIVPAQSITLYIVR
jgi:glycosyl hydrolase family 39 (putative alpha-L-iduronidase)